MGLLLVTWGHAAARHNVPMPVRIGIYAKNPSQATKTHREALKPLIWFYWKSGDNFNSIQPCVPEPHCKEAMNFFSCVHCASYGASLAHVERDVFPQSRTA